MRRRLPLILLGLAVFLYFFTYGLKSLNNYWGFNMPSFDFAIYDQGLWLLSRFEEPFVTILGLHLFGDHTSFILLPFVPLYWLWPSGALLLIAQALALALGAVPLFLLGRRLLGSDWLALGPAVAYLLTPALGWLNLENFHPDSFEVPLALFAIYFMVVRRWFWFAVAVVFLLAVKEDVALLTAPLGLYVAWRYHRRVGLITFFGSVAWMMLAIYLIQPYFSGVEPGALDSWRIPFGGPGGVVKTAFTDPSALAAHVFTGEKMLYVLQLLLPTAFLALASPLALVALPVLGFNLLSTFFYQYHLEYHYYSLIIPVAWAATVFGLARIPWRDVRRGAVVAILLTTALSAYLWGPLGWSLQPSGVADPESERAASAREAIAMIPEDAAVSAWYAYASHLTHRAEIYDFPNPWYASYWGDDSQKGQRLARADSVDYVLIPANLSEGPSLDVSQRLTAEEGFTAIWEESGLVLYASPEAAGAD